MARLGRQRRIRSTYLRNRSVVTPTPLVRNRVRVNNSRRLAIVRATKRHRPIVLRAPSPALVVFVRPNIVVHKRKRFVVRHHQARIISSPRIAPLVPYVRPKIVVHTTSKTRAYRRRYNTIIVMGSVRGSAAIPPPPSTGISRKYRIDTFGFY